jgi:hypothetical protein
MRKPSLFAFMIIALASAAFAQSTNEHEVAIQQLLKTEKEASEYIELIKSDVERSPFELSTYLSISRQFFVWKISTYDARNILTICADAAAALDRRDETFAGLSGRVGVLWGKKSGSLYGNPLAIDRLGIPVWEILAERVGMSADRLKQVTLENKLNARVAAKFLIKDCSRRYGGTARKIWMAQWNKEK